MGATAVKVGSFRLLAMALPLLAVWRDTFQFGVLRERSCPLLCLDTGPPESSSFAELVLQRSLLAHAPPSFA
jgi:hypothetical protein